MTFELLAQNIESIQTALQQQAADDNPPIGLLLCADYGETVVKYATGGLDPNLFVQKYHIQLPTEEEIMAFIAQSIRSAE